MLWNIDNKMKKKNSELITILRYAARREVKLDIILEKTKKEQKL